MMQQGDRVARDPIAGGRTRQKPADLTCRRRIPRIAERRVEQQQVDEMLWGHAVPRSLPCVDRNDPGVCARVKGLHIRP